MSGLKEQSAMRRIVQYLEKRGERAAMLAILGVFVVVGTPIYFVLVLLYWRVCLALT